MDTIFGCHFGGWCGRRRCLRGKGDVGFCVAQERRNTEWGWGERLNDKGRDEGWKWIILINEIWKEGIMWGKEDSSDPHYHHDEAVLVASRMNFWHPKENLSWDDVLSWPQGELLIAPWKSMRIWTYEGTIFMQPLSRYTDSYKGAPSMVLLKPQTHQMYCP